MVFSTHFYFLVFGRCLSGIAQAFLCTYTPVWINEFAPVESATTWMALPQALGILGTIIGLIIGSAAADIEYLGSPEYFDWRKAFLVQAIGFLIILAIFACFTNEYLDTLYIEKAEVA